MGVIRIVSTSNILQLNVNIGTQSKGKTWAVIRVDVLRFQIDLIWCDEYAMSLSEDSIGWRGFCDGFPMPKVQIQ
jgi:hypothetical protein